MAVGGGQKRRNFDGITRVNVNEKSIISMAQKLNKILKCIDVTRLNSSVCTHHRIFPPVRRVSPCIRFLLFRTWRRLCGSYFCTAASATTGERRRFIVGQQHSCEHAPEVWYDSRVSTAADARETVGGTTTANDNNACTISLCSCVEHDERTNNYLKNIIMRNW